MMANGGYVKWGIEIMDWGFSLNSASSKSKDNLTMYYNMGISVKFGNYKSPVQFEIGIKPGYVSAKYSYYVTDSYSYGYGYSYSQKKNETRTFFHMPIFTKIKINACDLESGIIYIAGLGTYNAIREKLYENEYSIGFGVGMAWEKWDWFALYYKQDLENKKQLNDNFLGTSFVYYF
jgi:hypothetical protein